MASLNLKLEVFVPVPDDALETLKEMCRIMVRIQRLHETKRPIRPEYQTRFEALKQRFVRHLQLPPGYVLDNFTLDSEAFLDAEEHAKLRAEG